MIKMNSFVIKKTNILINSNRGLKTIANGVQFNTIAREWRMKWSPENEKQSLSNAQNELVKIKNDLKSLTGLKSVQRIVCGGCHDFKVIVSLDADKWADWEKTKFQPEERFLSAIKNIKGISQVETQTYTIMPVEL